LYVEYIKKDIGLPPDLDAARGLAQTLQLDIFIDGPDLSWSSTGQVIDRAAIEIYRRRKAGNSLLDPIRIKLLLRNLASNALRHNNADNGPVLLSVEQTAVNTIFRVQDFGGGMTAAQIRHVTEPFWRSDTSRQRTTGGTGLGLYLCRKIAEAHGGHLEVQSVLGQGTNVVVELPTRYP
jgi:signal transduction histidine kinase